MGDALVANHVACAKGCVLERETCFEPVHLWDDEMSLMTVGLTERLVVLPALERRHDLSIKCFETSQKLAHLNRPLVLLRDATRNPPHGHDQTTHDIIELRYTAPASKKQVSSIRICKIDPYCLNHLRVEQSHRRSRKTIPACPKKLINDETKDARLKLGSRNITIDPPT
jgi:hypothetical protein